MFSKTGADIITGYLLIITNHCRVLINVCPRDNKLCLVTRVNFSFNYSRVVIILFYQNVRNAECVIHLEHITFICAVFKEI